MKIADKHVTLHRGVSPGLVLGGILLMTQAAAAQTFTVVPSTCTPDLASAGLYSILSGTTVQFSAAAPANATIKFRCNVPSPTDVAMVGVPAWNKLNVAFTDPDGAGGAYIVQADLYRVPKIPPLPLAVPPAAGAYGVPVLVATKISAGPGPGVGTTVFGHVWDFVNNEYDIELILTRNGPLSPRVWYVGLD